MDLWIRSADQIPPRRMSRERGTYYFCLPKLSEFPRITYQIRLQPTGSVIACKITCCIVWVPLALFKFLYYGIYWVCLVYYIRDNFSYRRPNPGSSSDSKACREKKRRDKLNERYALIFLFVSKNTVLEMCNYCTNFSVS